MVLPVFEYESTQSGIVPHHKKPPTLSELGDDLLQVSMLRIFLTLSAPFFCIVSYIIFAWIELWLLALLSIVALSFVTYGSTSHDLVHRTLKLPRWLNDFMLSLIELLSLRSGTAYRLSHLHHHVHLLNDKDIEGTTAHHGFWFALASGPFMQIRLWCWAWHEHAKMRFRLALEALGIMCIIIIALISLNWSLAPLVYVVLVVGGSWFFPLVTVYFPHDATASETLKKTLLFRGRILQLIAFGHLYHLEHHMYPAVPHHHWKKLADRLDPYFQSEGIKPFNISSK